MNIDNIRTLLGWCAVGNYALLMVWFLAFVLARNGLYAWHRRWFELSFPAFCAVHYAGMAWYKLSIWMLFLVPYLILRLAF